MSKTKLNLKFDRIRSLEEAGKLKPSMGNTALRKMLKNRLTLIGLVVFAVILLASLFAPLITSQNPMKINPLAILQEPSWEHIFGTDTTGRDVFAQVLYSGRVSILVGLGGALIAAFIGVFIGCYAGYKGGWVDVIALRVSEIFKAFPQIILVLLLVSIVGKSLLNIILIFVLTGWGAMYRLTRSRVLSLREEEYVQALQAYGLSSWLICYKHILPNAMRPIAVNIAVTTAMFVLAEAGLGFLGLGVSPSIPTWGNMLIVMQDLQVLQNNWWLWLPVGMVISLFVMAINFIGDGLRDSADPTLQG